LAFDLATSALLGLGLVLLAAPAMFLWLLHGDGERYRWLISGPRPFDQWGSGPYQLFTCFSLVFASATCLGTATALRRSALRGEPPTVRDAVVTSVMVAAATGVLSVAAAVLAVRLAG